MKKRIKRWAKLFARLGAARPWHCARALEAHGDYPQDESNLWIVIIPVGEDLWEEWWVLPKGAVRTYTHDPLCLGTRGWPAVDRPTVVPIPE